MAGAVAVADVVVVADDVLATAEEDAPLTVELLVEEEGAGVDEGFAETCFFFVLGTARRPVPATGAETDPWDTVAARGVGRVRAEVEVLACSRLVAGAGAVGAEVVEPPGEKDTISMGRTAAPAESTAWMAKDQLCPSWERKM